MKYHLENYADIRGNYGTFSTEQDLKDHVKTYGYKVTNIQRNTASVTYWINQTPLL